jgi:hypothetical protein
LTEEFHKSSGQSAVIGATPQDGMVRLIAPEDLQKDVGVEADRHA